jgi:lysophospholipase L1-like esterase
MPSGTQSGNRHEAWKGVFAEPTVGTVNASRYRWLLPFGLAASSFAIALFLGEGLSRLVLDPVNYLAVDPVTDTVLRIRLPPGAGGHDAWGFRNERVPDSVDVVTIGDSQTYGVSAPAHESWPSQLARLTGLRVYNLALGGYGPVQYHELLRSRARELKPAVVLVGFYYGNDLWDAYTTVYSLNHWGALRRPNWASIPDTTGRTVARAVALAPLRDWLARHSVLYRLVTYSALGGAARQFEVTLKGPTSGAVNFIHPAHGARTRLTPDARLGVLDLRDSTIREGLRLSLDQLAAMAAELRTTGTRYLVVLIPTKEWVYAPWLGKLDRAEYAALRMLLEQESEVHHQVRDWLDQHGIEYVDLEPALRKAAATAAIYPENEDGHPTSAGYAVIAKAVAKALGTRDRQGLHP